MKTIERAHTPAKLWERIKLSQNYTKALETVTEQLEHWPKALQHRNKQRLTKIYQYLVRSRRLKLKQRTKLVAINSAQEQLEGRREEKALKAAKLESSIKNELLERLKRGTYGDIYNFPEVQYNEALDEAVGEIEDEEEDEAAALEAAEEEEEEFELEDEEEDDEDVGLVEYVADFGEGGEESEEEESDIEDGLAAASSSSSSSRGGGSGGGDGAVKKRPAGVSFAPEAPAAGGKKGKKAKRPSGPRVEVEYEDDEEESTRQLEPSEVGW